MPQKKRSRAAIDLWLQTAEPETVLPIVRPEPETAPPIMRPEPETVPPIVRSDPETVPPIMRPEPETVPPIVRSDPETVPPIVRPDPETVPPIVRPEPETGPPIVRPAPIKRTNRPQPHLGIQDTHSARVVAEIANPDGNWRPGSLVHAAVAIEERSAALAVLVSAIQTIDKMRVLFVRTPGGFEQRQVMLGDSDDRLFEVLDVALFSSRAFASSCLSRALLTPRQRASGDT
jgi:hypothetical protein